VRGSVDDEGRMPLIEHLRELRSRLIRASLAIVAGSVVAWFAYNHIIEVLIRPVCNAGAAGVSNTRCGPVVVSSVLGPLSLQLKVSLYGGLLIASPVWLYQLWAFLAPGLHRNEKRWTYAFVGSGVPLFLMGAGAAYLLLPKAVRVLLGFTPGGVGNIVPLDDYLDFVLRMLLVFGLAFELPLVLVVANLAGLLSARRIASWWRGIVFGIFVFAAAATPTGAFPIAVCASVRPSPVTTRSASSRRAARSSSSATRSNPATRSAPAAASPPPRPPAAPPPSRWRTSTP
jgi:sec-independent protein translocase protein TatC